MPELPDIELYVTCLRHNLLGKRFAEFNLYNPFGLRTYAPKVVDFVGVPISTIGRMGKRVVFGFDDGKYMVIHLMVSGRFRWLKPEAKVLPKITHATWRFEGGRLALTEASSKKRAGIWLFASRDEAWSLDPGGIDPMCCTSQEFAQALRSECRTLKRALTNPRRFSGIGNAFSDEILHAARLSPLKLSQSLSDAECEALFEATKATLAFWTDKLIRQFGGGTKFPGPGDVTAFRTDYSAHGKFNQPCPVCGKPIQRIVYAENETNYCAVCQNGGRILADRSTSKLLKGDWPRSFAEEEG